MTRYIETLTDDRDAYTLEVFDSDGTAAIQIAGQDVLKVSRCDSKTAGDEYAQPHWRTLDDDEHQELLDAIADAVTGRARQLERIVAVIDWHASRAKRGECTDGDAMQAIFSAGLGEMTAAELDEDA